MIESTQHAGDAPVSVLFDAHQLGRRQTGNETYVRGLLAAFRQRDDLRVEALIEDRAAGDPLVAAPFDRRRVPRSGLRRLLAMGSIARRSRPDVVHAVYFAPYGARRPMVVTIHDISFEFYPEFFRRSEVVRDRLLIRDSARRARIVVTVSETSRRDIIQRYGLPDSKVIAIHNGVGRSYLEAPAHEVEEIGDRPVRILALGTLQPRKNLLRLLAAVRSVAARRPVSLRVVGPDGHQAASIREQLADAAQVEVVGYVDDAGLQAEYAGADMLVYPSLYEGFGLPLVEAMAVGLPVITSTGGALPEIAGDAALIVDPLDEGAIATAILRLADDRKLRSTLGTKGRARAAGFTWERSAQLHVDAYRDASGT